MFRSLTVQTSKSLRLVGSSHKPAARHGGNGQILKLQNIFKENLEKSMKFLLVSRITRKCVYLERKLKSNEVKVPHSQLHF